MRKFLVIEEENDDITHKVVGDADNLVSFRSNSPNWCDDVKGEVIGSLKDTGNNIKLKIGNKKLKLDYAEFCDLYDLMSIKTQLDGHTLRESTLILEA